MSRPDPVDTLPHLTTAALLQGIETAARRLGELGASGGAPRAGTEADMVLTSLLQYTECIEARLRPRDRRGGRCTSIGRAYVNGEDRRVRCELRADHDQGNHQATFAGVPVVWDWAIGWDQPVVPIVRAPRSAP